MRYGKYQALTPQEASKIYCVEFNAWIKLLGNLIVIPFPRPTPLGLGLESYKQIFPKGHFIFTSPREDRVWKDIMLVLIEV